MPEPVEAQCTSSTWHGPSFGFTAADTDTVLPSMENFTPKATLPSGGSSVSSIAHSSASTTLSTPVSGAHQPNRSRASFAASICSISVSMVEGWIVMPRDGFVAAHMRLSRGSSGISGTLHSSHDVVLVLPPSAAARMRLKTVPGESSSGGVPA